MEYFFSARQAALALGRDPGVVQDLCRRKEISGAFKGEDGRYKIPKGPEPPGLPRRDKLTEEEGREIARLAHAGANRTRLAERHGIKRNHVHWLMRKYPAIGVEEAARVVARHSRTAEEAMLEGG